ncbi:uncharacterized protein LOC110854514 isoform X2 [Folsomia candida]|uniref:uncharacterized protein LOC110854514 isoform X2 n=1 Tax=Folsomia candida TaxID=158441 RepID=UPI00160509B1|nr:uncharacterized protein LOC110854514 isoform X2 [Folsomia candida]
MASSWYSYWRRTFLGLLGWTILFPVLSFILIPSTILWLLHDISAKLFRPDLIPLRVQDGNVTSAPSEDHVLMNCCQVWRLRGHLSLKKFREHFHTCFLNDEETSREKYANFWCRFVRWGLYCYKLDSEAVVERFIGTWMSKSTYRSGPLWEILIAHRPDETILLFKIDHGLCDGYTFIHLVEKLSGVAQPYLVSDKMTPFLTRLNYIVQLPLTLRELVTGWRRGGGAIRYRTRANNAVTAVGEAWMISMVTLDLMKVKEIRRKLGYRFSTVCAALLVGAWARWVKDEGECETDFLMGEEGCHCLSPVGWPGHPIMTGGGMGNHFSALVPTYPYDFSDSINRMLSGERTFQRWEDTGLLWILMKIVFPIVHLFPQDFYSAILDSGVKSNIHFMSSPLLCSDEKHFILGHEAKHLFLPVQVPQYLRSIHLYLIPTTFSRQLDVSVNATKRMFPTYEKLEKFTKVYLPLELNHVWNKVMNLSLNKK